jgi:hypothetical protein
MLRGGDALEIMLPPYLRRFKYSNYEDIKRKAKSLLKGETTLKDEMEE